MSGSPGSRSASRSRMSAGMSSDDDGGEEEEAVVEGEADEMGPAIPVAIDDEADDGGDADDEEGDGDDDDGELPPLPPPPPLVVVVVTVPTCVALLAPSNPARSDPTRSSRVSPPVVTLEES